MGEIKIMGNEIIKQIEKLREINKNHKLVIFVGAGVSKNSGVCTWFELIKEIAQKINYNDVCEKCNMKHLICSDCGENLELCSYNNYNCQFKYNFSTDDFLKIPQYFHDTRGEKKYFEFLNEKFCKSTYTPNELDNLIIELNPEHIITTNYDHLLEDVQHPNRSNYRVIKNDTDILKQYGRQYIIKMHGDIEDIENIVLKEEDYLKYSKSHELIETYIKSLLLDKTFLFIGYSLNDNNLKLIMSYINYFAKNKDVSREKHYLVVNQLDNKERDIKYWGNKNISLVDLTELSKIMINNTPNKLNDNGKPLYTFLKYIKDDTLPYSSDKATNLKHVLYNTLQSYNMFNFISRSTILKLCGFYNHINFYKDYVYVHKEKDYRLLESIFAIDDNKTNEIKRVFVKSGINYISFNENNIIKFQTNCIDTKKLSDCLFDYSLKNKYSEIIKQLNNCQDNFEKAYYYFLIYRNTNNKCQNTMINIEKEITSFNYKLLSDDEKLKIALYQYNSISLRILCYQRDNNDIWTYLNELLDSASIQNEAFNLLKQLNGNNGEIINELNNFLISHEEYYMKKSKMTKFGGTIYGDLLKIQVIVYDYYTFYKKNYIMLDWFTDVSKICEPYIKAILCTYYPDGYQYSNNSLFGKTYTKVYPLSLMDIDIIVKHCDYKQFINWLSYYKVFYLKIDESTDIAELFCDFCISLKNFWIDNYIEHLKIFLRLLSLVELTEGQQYSVIRSLIELLTPCEKVGIDVLNDILIELNIYIQKHFDENDKTYKQLLELLINKELIKSIVFYNRKSYEELIVKLLPYADEKIYNRSLQIVEHGEIGRTRCSFVFLLHDILLKFYRKKWTEWISNNIENNLIEEIFEYLYNDIIIYNEKVNQFFANHINSNTKNNAIQTFPDNRPEAINTLILLLILGKIKDIKDISFLKEFCDESVFLDFLFNTDTFDYSKINIANSMWCNLINSPKYRGIILEHKKDFWSKEEEKRIKLGFGGDFENRIAYKYLFD